MAPVVWIDEAGDMEKIIDKMMKRNKERLKALPEATLVLYQRQVIENYYRDLEARTEFENRRLGRAMLTER